MKRFTRDEIEAIRSSPETNAELARQFQVSRQCISKIRLNKTHSPAVVERDTKKAEAVVRAILARPADQSHQSVARALGLSRETVRKVRYGLQWADLAPELERLDQASQGAFCSWCVHWKAAGTGSCTLGIPEAVSEGQLHARGCGAFKRSL